MYLWALVVIATVCSPHVVALSAYFHEMPAATLPQPTIKPERAFGGGGSTVESAMSFAQAQNEQAALDAAYASDDATWARAASAAGTCSVGDWGTWGACSSAGKCGAVGSATRSRTIAALPGCHFPCCPPTVQRRPCRSAPCNVPKCAVSVWGTWGACSVTCGVGVKKRGRNVCQLGRTFQTTACDQGPCPWHCQVSTWGRWGRCSATCGGGVRRRTRDIVYRRHPSVCPKVTDMGTCGTRPCPRPCRVSRWGRWSPCMVPPRKWPTAAEAANASASAGASASRMPAASIVPLACGQGGGVRVRTRRVVHEASHGAPRCSLRLRQERQCTGRECKCEMGLWGAWGACSASCGNGGIQLRTREVVHREGPSAACGELLQRRQCRKGARTSAGKGHGHSQGYAYTPTCPTPMPAIARCASLTAHGCTRCIRNVQCGWCDAVGECQFIGSACLKWAQRCTDGLGLAIGYTAQSAATAAPGCSCRDGNGPYMQFNRKQQHLFRESLGIEPTAWRSRSSMSSVTLRRASGVGISLTRFTEVWGTYCARWTRADTFEWCLVDQACVKLYTNVGALSVQRGLGPHGLRLLSGSRSQFWMRCLPAAPTPPPTPVPTPHLETPVPTPHALTKRKAQLLLTPVQRQIEALEAKIAAISGRSSAPVDTPTTAQADTRPENSTSATAHHTRPKVGLGHSAHEDEDQYFPAGCVCSGHKDALGQGSRCALWGRENKGGEKFWKGTPWCYAASDASRGSTCRPRGQRFFKGPDGKNMAVRCGSGHYFVLNSPSADAVAKRLWVEYSYKLYHSHGKVRSLRTDGDGWVRVLHQRASAPPAVQSHGHDDARWKVEDAGKAFVNTLFLRSTLRLLRFDVGGKPVAFYRRKQQEAVFDVHKLMMSGWSLGEHNRLHVDFDLYSSYFDALHQKRPWNCPATSRHPDVVGFPGRCAPEHNTGTSKHSIWAVHSDVAERACDEGVACGKKLWQHMTFEFYVHAPQAVAAEAPPEAVVGDSVGSVDGDDDS